MTAPTRNASPGYALAVHGGAGTLRRGEMSEEQAALYHAGLRAALAAGRDILADGAMDFPDEVLAELEASDPHIVRRQIGIVDSYGNTAAFSGPTSNGYSGHFMGRQWVAMGNAVVSEAVVKAIAASLESSEDEELWERLMRAVEAGGKAGGQAEGQRSAALLVFGAEPFALVDLRVDFHPEPIGELRRIYDWFRPLVPYYQERVLDPYIIREDIWREKKLAERADG